MTATRQLPDTEPLPIIGVYNVQRFKQFSPEDSANWYLSQADNAKKPIVMYPMMGRRHIRFLDQNVLVFDVEPRGLFRSVNYYYVVEGKNIYRVDKFFNKVEISQNKVVSLSGDIYFDYLIAGTITFAVFVDGINIYVYREDTGSFDIVTDANAPSEPKYVKAFGNRLVVSQNESSQFNLSVINLGGGSFNPSNCFTVDGAALFAQEAGIIRQFGVLHNTLYIFTDFTTGIWSNTLISFVSTGGTTTTFPFKKNTTYDWDFGIANPNSLDVDFGRLTWLAQNKNGLLQVMASDGGAPLRISTKAIDVLFQRDVNKDQLSPFLLTNGVGFLYEYENTIFYRLSAGSFLDIGDLDITDAGQCIEYNFETQSWARGVEKNGEKNRIKRHIFFNGRHLVTVEGDSTVFEMSGQFYTNEITNPDAANPQATDAYIQEPFLYERITPIIYEDDYSEFITDYVEIDFVWGVSNISYSTAPFANAQFLIAEDAAPDGTPQYLVEENPIDGEPVYILSEEGNTPEINSTTYNQIYKPHIELYFSDDGGVSFLPADVLEFSQMGYYQWRMRWYQLGPSRNRCYKLVCVSPVPIVVLGGRMARRRSSGGAS